MCACAYVLNERTCNISLQLFFQWPQHEVSYLALRFPRQVTKFSFWNKTTKKTGNNWPLSQPPVVEFVAHLIFFCFILIRTLLDTKGSDSFLSCLTVSLFFLFIWAFHYRLSLCCQKHAVIHFLLFQLCEIVGLLQALY